ncbi:MAG TPA: folate-binding protein [Pseudomonadales bacterium]|nr:folate-binding protein [Pseudomonadales bacterium]
MNNHSNTSDFKNNTHDFKQLADTTVVSRLDDDANGYGLLEITGIDSAKFLQGQITCNMQDITLQQSRLGAHCTHKGRMVASFRLLQTSENSYLFCLPKQILPALQKSLAKYIVFSKAKLRNASDDYLQLGISGPQAAQQISAIFGTTPTARNTQHANENGTVICVNETTPRFLCIVKAEREKNIREILANASTTVTDCHYWRWLDIGDGMGEVREQTIEEFIPQMLNMQWLDGISFTKGCYTGQEIVARMQYRGTLKKGMYRIAGNGTAPLPNDAVFHDDTGQATGHMVMAENFAPEQWEGLAVITHDAIEHALFTAEKIPVALLPLPYALNTTE